MAHKTGAGAPGRGPGGRGLVLCTAGPGCFRCCPPLRPAGYDHLPWRTSLVRLLVDNTQRWRRGQHGGQVVGWWCWGLGFVGPGRVGCLLHPGLNHGQDLRRLTGYGFKCAAYWCPQARAFAALEPATARWLLARLGPEDPFSFSSPASALMRLLDLGPGVSQAVASLRLNKESLKYLLEVDPRSGWIVEQMVKILGGQVVVARELGEMLEWIRRELGKVVAGGGGGVRLEEVVGMWEARAWRWLGAGFRVCPEWVRAWREELEGLIRALD